MKLGSSRLAPAVLAALLALPLRADDTDTRACPAIDPPAAQKALPSEALAKEGGLRVFRDPETGKWRPPTREEAAELDRAEAEAAPETERIFRVVEHPDGMTSVDLQGAFAQAVVVTRNADGSLTFRCVPARPAAASAAAPAPTAPVPQARVVHEER